MLDQTFSLLDIPRLGLLILLELLLSSDNAVAIATISRSLPHALRKRAIWIGYIASYAFRAVAIIVAGLLIRAFWFQAIGAAYLIYLSMRHLAFRSERRATTSSPKNFLKVVILIELTDLVFAMDSILAGFSVVGVSFPTQEFPPKMWIIYIGGLIGAAFVRFASTKVGEWMDRLPYLEEYAYILVGWIGWKLMFQAGIVYFDSYHGIALIWTSRVVETVFWLGALSVIFSACYRWKKGL